jgi:uncharacterized phage-associated protein
MDHDSKAVANVFISLSKGDRDRKYLTNMQIQKLVYIAHGFNLAALGEPLFRDRVYAWQFGPVIPSLYDALKEYGSGEVKHALSAYTPQIKTNSREWKVIKSVWDGYGQFSGPKLSSMTHKPGTPWADVWMPGTHKEIPNDTIRHYYPQFIDAGLLQRLAEPR